MLTTNMRKERLKRKWTLERVGREIGISNQSISRIELGEAKPSYNVLLKLENLFGENHRYLFEQTADAPREDYNPEDEEETDCFGQKNKGG